MAGTRHPRRLSWRICAPIALLLAAVAVGVPASPADARMRSKLIDNHLCKTVHGGRFVDIPGFPGEKIDRRLLRDIRWMKRHFDVFITDGYSTASYHAPSGEHPVGLATDIVPYKSKGGTWDKIARLAHKTEPKQNYPIPPWRWVGWNGDPNHGRGNHLHLSWMHSETDPKDPARVVYTRKCPERRHRHRSHDGRSSRSTGGISLSELTSKVAPPVPEYH